jgi:SIR2-like domain
LNTSAGVRYRPKPLSEAPVPAVAALVDDGRRNRLILYLGAGLSIPSPACGPSGNDVADKLRPIVAELLGVTEADLREPDLESLVARFEHDAPERLNQLKGRAAQVWHFRDMEPAYGHEIVALLLREGLARAVSANWDCGVENGGVRVEVPIEGISREIDVRDPADGALCLYKLHGCARRPGTLVLTREEVNEPRRWARAKVEDALAGGTVVFVGLGTLGTYVSEPVQELTDVWTDGTTTVRVVDPFGLSPDWKTVLQERADEVALLMGADEFLDDLLRAAVSEALSCVGEQARKLHDREQQSWSEATVTGHAALGAALADTPADAVLRWWRDGVTSVRDGQPFIFDSAGQTALMCIAQLAADDGSQMIASGTDGSLTIRTKHRYFESAYRPLEHCGDVANLVRARIDLRRRNGWYAPGTPITVAITGATGKFPPFSAPPSLPTFRETLMIKELLTLEGENGARHDVGHGERGRRGPRSGASRRRVQRSGPRARGGGGDPGPRVHRAAAQTAVHG